MGPDHPITGGYPLIGYVAGDDLEALFALPPGSPVHFALRDL
jgi:allophanate hydrolase subunit 2